MHTAPTSLAESDVRSQARRGLAVFFAILVPLTAIFQAIIITTGNMLWFFALMWSVTAASVVARLVLREGFADVSFRFGGRRTWKYIALALIIPLVIGLIAYGIAWATSLARFDPQAVGWVVPLVGDTASPSRFSWPRLPWQPPSGLSLALSLPPAKRSAGVATCSRGS